MSVRDREPPARPAEEVPIEFTREETEFLRILETTIRELGLQQAYIVGGWPRNKLLGLSSQDFDVVWEGQPPAAELLDRLARHIGLSEVFVSSPKVHVSTIEEYPLLGLEVFTLALTTYDEKRRFTVGLRALHGGSAQADSLARDFTVNAVYFDPLRQRFFSAQEGLDDLRARLLRTVDSVERTFYRSPSRAFRLVRLVAKYGFRLERRLEIYMRSVDFWEDFHRRYRPLYPARLRLNVLAVFRDAGAAEFLAAADRTGFSSFFKFESPLPDERFYEHFREAVQVLRLLEQAIDRHAKHLLDDYYHGAAPPAFLLHARLLCFAFTFHYYAPDLSDQFLRAYTDLTPDDLARLEDYFDFLNDLLEECPSNFKVLNEDAIAKLPFDHAKWALKLVALAYSSFQGHQSSVDFRLI